MLKKLRYIIALNLSIVMIFSSILPVSVFTYASNDKISDVEYELLDKLEIVTHDDLKNIDCIELKTISDINKYSFVVESFPDICQIDEVPEHGLELFMKLTEEINEKNQEEVGMILYSIAIPEG